MIEGVGVPLPPVTGHDVHKILLFEKCWALVLNPLKCHRPVVGQEIAVEYSNAYKSAGTNTVLL